MSDTGAADTRSTESTRVGDGAGCADRPMMEPERRAEVLLRLSKAAG
jgi:hypothetical protein